MSDLVVSFPFHPLFRVAAAPFGVSPATTALHLEGDHLEIRFGPWRLRTPLANVAAATVTTGYAWPKVLGPPRLSLADRGITFATNPHAGVCIRFRRPVPAIEPFKLVRHPGATVTVADPARLAELLDRARHHPERVHRPAPGGEPVEVDDLVVEESDELAGLTAAELRERARRRGLAGVSRMTKAELVDRLSVG